MRARRGGFHAGSTPHLHSMSAQRGGSGPPTLMAISTDWSEAGCECLQNVCMRNQTGLSLCGSRRRMMSALMQPFIPKLRGKGPEQKYRIELPVNHKQAQSRLVPSSLQVPNQIEGRSSRGRFLLGVPCFRNWSDIKPLRMKHHLRDVLSPASFTGQLWRKSMDRDCRSDVQSPEISRQHSAAS